ELAAAGDQGRLAGLDHDDVVEAERGDQAAVVGDDDRVRGLVGEHVALDDVALRVLGKQVGQGSPVADVVPVVTDFEYADVRGFFHHGLVDRGALHPGIFQGDHVAFRRCAERIADPGQGGGELGPVALQLLQDGPGFPEEDPRVPGKVAGGDETLGGRAVGLFAE